MQLYFIFQISFKTYIFTYCEILSNKKVYGTGMKRETYAMLVRKMTGIDNVSPRRTKHQKEKKKLINIPVDLNIPIKYAISSATSNAFVELS